MLGKISWKKVLFSCIVLAPALYLSYFLLKYSVNVPYWDQWGATGGALDKIHQGKLSITDLFAQHNEHRVFFPKLIFIPLAYLTGWDTRYEVLLTFLLACLTSLNIYRLSKLSIGEKQFQLVGLAFTSNLLIFSPGQYENWLWGFQSILLFPMFYITSCLLVASSRLQMSVRFLLCVGFSILSSFSLSNGLFCWVAALLALWFCPDFSHLKWKRRLILLWLGGFISTLALYFHGYHRDPNNPGLREAINHPQQAIAFFFSFLGSPLSASNVTLAAFLGAVLFFLFLSFCLYIIYKLRKDWRFIHSTGNWVIIGLFVLASALAATTMRLLGGVEQALSSRYTSFSLYLTIAVLQLGAIVANDFMQNKSFISLSKYIPPFFGNSIASRKVIAQRLVSICLIACTLAVIVTSLLSSINRLQIANVFWRDRLYGRTCLTFVNFVDDRCIIASLFPSAPFLRDTAATLEGMGFIQPDLAQTPRLNHAVSMHRQHPQEYGRLNSLKQSAPDEFTANGWAVIPEKEKPADSVLLTYSKDKEEPIIFAVAPVKLPRSNVATDLSNNQYLNSGWETTFSSKNLPVGRLRIDAWAFDVTSGDAFRMKGFKRLEAN